MYDKTWIAEYRGLADYCRKQARDTSDFDLKRQWEHVARQYDVLIDSAGLLKE
jgi:hypothetical protein